LTGKFSRAQVQAIMIQAPNVHSGDTGPEANAVQWHSNISSILDIAHAKYPHVYLDTSYVFFQYILEMALTTCPDKIIFGSDAPGVHPAVSISCILLARVSDEVKQMVLADNICRILGEIAA
jgi:predicted TIM-barrel fold metal-dependent hydrolase